MRVRTRMSWASLASIPSCTGSNVTERMNAATGLFGPHEYDSMKPNEAN